MSSKVGTLRRGGDAVINETINERIRTMTTNVKYNGSFKYINGYCSGPDGKKSGEDHTSYQIGTEEHGGKIVVYGDRKLRDEILDFLQST